MLVHARVPRRLRAVEERFVAGHRVALLRDGARAFPAMLDAIREARRQVLLEMYWFDSDEIGRRFAGALIDAARRGVEVALIYDSLGSWEADPEMFDEMRRAGVGVIEYNPLAPWKKRFRLGRLTRRDHRKILVVDARIGFTGGINLADVWKPEQEGGRSWRDDMISIEGQCVSGLLECFRHTWRAEGGRPLKELGVEQCTTDGQLAVRVLGENFRRHRREIAAAYLYNIYRAERRIWLSNSYFVPDPRVFRALTRAARRGVDVRVILPGESDVPIVRYASRAMWSGLMRRGVRIFEWIPTILHSKSAVVDGRWSTVGSFNLDYLSLRNNLEVNVAVLDESFGALMEEAFRSDLEQCREVDPHEFIFRPLGDRLLEFVLYRFRKLL
jgi:cardiolipin synthase A/B